MMDKRQVCDLALHALADTESMKPCEVMAEHEHSWCATHCRPEYTAAQAHCWRQYLETDYARKWANAVTEGTDDTV